LNKRTDFNRLAIWLVIAFLLATANFAAFFTTSSSSNTATESLFKWSVVISDAVFYGIWVAVSLWISAGRRTLRAFRRTRIGVGAIIGIAVLSVIAAYLATFVVTAFGGNPSKEQGLLTQHWQPGKTAPFIASVVVITVLTPIAEELFVRGLGFGLFRPLGKTVGIAIPALVWALMHGLPAAVFPLFVFGLGLGYLRERSDSVIPGMFIHGIYNGIALALAFA
jgi:membrane protease YdiL (CAAX protease family)